MDLREQKEISLPDFKRHPWELARFKILDFFLKKIPFAKFIVDVGSGDAFIAKQLSQRCNDCKVAAIDVNYDQQFIKDNTTTNLSFSNAIDNFHFDDPVDVVLLMDVLEHIEKPETLLRDIISLNNVSSSTQFFITVPAFQSLFSQHDSFLKHFRRYSRKQLEQLVTHEGFEVRSSGYFFTSLLIARVTQKVFGTVSKHGIYNWKGSRLLTSFLISAFWIDFKISWYLSRIGINIPGLSCYCICRPLPS